MAASDHFPIELLVRAVILVDAHVLLACNNKAEIRHLPGGHVERGQGAREALQREIREELGRDSKIGRFLGAIEHAFEQEGEFKHEINLLFEVTVPGLSIDRVPESPEAKLDLFWERLDTLADCALRPAVLADLLPRWLFGPGSLFGSNIEEPEQLPHGATAGDGVAVIEEE
ncbi:MAG TPA: NUDIX domain-containing protein [bacterium]|nr:NUDIX domain-containing protein [bacterium]